MTSPTSPPNRRRRRIVVTVAVLAAGLCWWLWPRVDQRFVGKWRFEFHGEPEAGSIVLELRSDGTANLTSITEPGEENTRWWVSRTELLLGDDVSKYPAVEFLRQVRPLQTILPVLDATTWKLIRVKRDEILLQSDYDGRIEVLTRLSE